MQPNAAPAVLELLEATFLGDDIAIEERPPTWQGFLPFDPERVSRLERYVEQHL